MTRKTSRLGEPKSRFGTLKPRLEAADFRTVKPPPKRADPELLTPEHRAWRATVLKNAGYRCETCGVKPPMLIADHVIERRDGGARYDPLNGKAACPSCHSLKTAQERAKRLAARPSPSSA